jgi:hypothetical protein
MKEDRKRIEKGKKEKKTARNENNIRIGVAMLQREWVS